MALPIWLNPRCSIEMSSSDPAEKCSDRRTIQCDGVSPGVGEKTLALSRVVTAHVSYIPPRADIVTFRDAEMLTVGDEKLFGHKTECLRDLTLENTSSTPVDCDGRSFHKVGD